MIMLSFRSFLNWSGDSPQYQIRIFTDDCSTASSQQLVHRPTIPKTAIWTTYLEFRFSRLGQLMP